ncbi:MAG TPA: response regulator [Tepidisphaeraceae bacterium]|nr:response regulator [Tepidisphaeraceae bacterium]
MQHMRSKVLVLAGQSAGHAAIVESIRQHCDLVEIPNIEQAIEALRNQHFDAVFSDSGDFLPLERALVSQQASLILNTLGEGVCIVDGEGRCNWMNKKMQAWPPRVHEKIRRKCQEAFELFSKQVSPANPSADTPVPLGRSKRYALNIEDQQFMEMIASPVMSSSGAVVQIVAVVWDATGTRRMQQKIDAIDMAGRELVRLDADAMSQLNVQQRLKLLEDKIVSFTKELLHFDHFAIRLLDRRTNKLEMVISVGLPQDAVNIELFASPEGNGISGYVAATGRSYICPDVERDPRYVMGLDQARSTLTVPLRLHDKVIGIFNVESRQRAAFNEDDRQFAEIFGRYVAIALNILDLMIVERSDTRHKVADDVNAEVAGPLNDIALDLATLMEESGSEGDLRSRLQSIMNNVSSVRQSLRQAAEGPHTVLGASEVVGHEDPLISGARVLVADDDLSIRTTISDVLRKYHAEVTTAGGGMEAIDKINQSNFDLVVSDIRMPDKSGYDVFAAVRKRSQSLPVILMTAFGYDREHCILRATQEGLQAVLYKPFRVEQLLAAVRKALRPTAGAER